MLRIGISFVVVSGAKAAILITEAYKANPTHPYIAGKGIWSLGILLQDIASHLGVGGSLVYPHKSHTHFSQHTEHIWLNSRAVNSRKKLAHYFR